MSISDKNCRWTDLSRLPTVIWTAAFIMAGLLSGSTKCWGQQNNPIIEFSSAIFFADEDSGAATITVTRGGNTSGAVTVSYGTGKGLATPGIDYTPQSGALSFASGETNQTFSVPLLDDPLAEGSETVALTLTNASGGAVLGNRATARLYIQDSENRGTLLDSTFQGAIQPSDFVSALALQSDGKVIASGRFVRSDPASFDRVIRLNTDGSRDASFATVNAGPNGRVVALAVQPDGKIIIGGEFTGVGSTNRNRIARLNPDGSLDLSFDPGSGVAGNLSPGVYAITLQGDGKVLIGGNFDTVNGVGRNTLARLNANGSLDASFNAGAGISSSDLNFLVPWISTIVVQADGKVLIGGQFTDVDGIAFLNIARLNSDGSADASFDPGAGVAGDLAGVESIALQPDGKIIIGGNFATVDDISRNSLARLNADGSIDLSFDLGEAGVKDREPNGAETVGLVTSIAVQNDGKVLFSGLFLTVDDINRHGIARVSRDGALDGTFGPYFGTTYRNELGYEELESAVAMALQPDGKILIGGTFVSEDESRTNRLTRLLAANVRTSSFEFLTPSTSANESGGPMSVTVIRRGESGDAFAADFGTTSGTATPGADYTTQSGTLKFGPLETKKTISLPILEDRILEEDETFEVRLGSPSAGAALGTPAQHVIRIIDSKKPGNLDFSFAEVRIPFPPDPVAFWPVTAITVQKDAKVIVAGNFAFVNGTNRAGVVRLNPDGAIDPSFVPQAPPGSPILVLLQMGLQPDGRLVGGFDGVFRLNLDGSLDTGFAPGSESVTALTVLGDGKFLVADEVFDPVGGVYVNAISRFLPNGTFDTSFGPPQFDDWVNSIVVQPDGKAVIGGYFTELNGAVQNRIARLSRDGSLDAVFNVGTGIQGRTNAAVYSLALQPDGKVIVAGDFNRINNVTRNNLARLNANGSLDTSFGRGSGPDAFIESVAVQPDGKVLIGGGFTSVDGVSRVGFARLNSDGTLDADYEPKLTFTQAISLSSIVVQADGKILIGGLFTAVNGVPRSGVARLLGEDSSLRLVPAPRSPVGPFRLTLTSQPGKQYRIEASTDLVNWVPISTNSATGITLQFEDTKAAEFTARFYRAALTNP